MEDIQRHAQADTNKLKEQIDYATRMIEREVKFSRNNYYNKSSFS